MYIHFLSHCWCRKVTNNKRNRENTKILEVEGVVASFLACAYILPLPISIGLFVASFREADRMPLLCAS